MNRGKKQMFFMTVLITLLFTIFIMPIQSSAESSNSVRSDVQATFVTREGNGGNGSGEENIGEDGNDNESEENNHGENNGMFPQTGDFFDMRLIILGLIMSFSTLVLIWKAKK